jgi:hypothetical protein
VQIKYSEPVNLLRLDFQIDELIDIDHNLIKFNFDLIKYNNKQAEQESIKGCPLLEEAKVTFYKVLDEKTLEKAQRDKQFKK